MGFQTDCTSTGEDREAYHGAVSPPIYAASLFTAPDLETSEQTVLGNAPERFVYSRGLNPTVRVLEKKLALLEHTEDCKFFASGMAAIAAVIMECATSGDHVIAARSLYNHTYKLLTEYLPRFNVEATFVDQTDIAAVEAAIRPNTKLLYLESPANPTMQVADLLQSVELAHRRGLSTAIDNSLATPYNQNPADYGIDYVLHTASKYLGGHSDIVGGAVAGSTERLQAIIGRQHADLGGIIGPFEAWLILRGIRTLGIRLKTHNANALTLATWLQGQSGVSRVHYPGLASHPQLELCNRQMRGGSGMIGIVLDGGFEMARRFVDSLRLFSIAVSWGGFESLALPMWKSAMPEDMRRSIGLDEGFVRISVGLEDVEDLRADLENGLTLMSNV